MMAARAGAAGGTSSARWRRERRLRSWAKHERLSVAMALAEKLHHSANRTVLQKKEEVEQHHASRGQKRARTGPGTQYLFIGGVCVPEPVGEPQLQPRVQRHTVEQRIEHTPHVQILDAPVPQVADYVLDVFRVLYSSIAEQVIVVFFVSFPFALSGTADGGYVGGSADCVVCLAPAAECGANR